MGELCHLKKVLVNDIKFQFNRSRSGGAVELPVVVPQVICVLKGERKKMTNRHDKFD